MLTSQICNCDFSLFYLSIEVPTSCEWSHVKSSAFKAPARYPKSLWDPEINKYFEVVLPSCWIFAKVSRLKDFVGTNVIISLLAGKYTIVSCPQLFDWLESFCTKSSQELIVETGPPGNMALEKLCEQLSWQRAQEPDTATMMGNKETVLGVGAWQKVLRARNKWLQRKPQTEKSIPCHKCPSCSLFVWHFVRAWGEDHNIFINIT